VTVSDTSSYTAIPCNAVVTFAVVISKFHNTFCRQELLGKGARRL
jgi:hypothetical protein